MRPTHPESRRENSNLASRPPTNPTQHRQLDTERETQDQQGKYRCHRSPDRPRPSPKSSHLQQPAIHLGWPLFHQITRNPLVFLDTCPKSFPSPYTLSLTDRTRTSPTQSPKSPFSWRIRCGDFRTRSRNHSMPSGSSPCI